MQKPKLSKVEHQTPPPDISFIDNEHQTPSDINFFDNESPVQSSEQYAETDLNQMLENLSHKFKFSYLINETQTQSIISDFRHCISDILTSLKQSAAPEDLFECLIRDCKSKKKKIESLNHFDLREIIETYDMKCSNTGAITPSPQKHYFLSLKMLFSKLYIEYLKEKTFMPQASRRYMSSFFDSKYFAWIHKKNTYYGTIYFDEITPGDPLQPNQEKYMMCYFSAITGISEHESKDYSVFCLGICNCDVIKKIGMKRYLEPLLNEIKELQEGILIQNTLVRLVIPYFSGDTPVQQALGGIFYLSFIYIYSQGFVIGVGSANFPCRTCYVQKKDIDNLREESHELLRSIEEHKKDLILLSKEGPNSSIRGVKSISPLSCVPNFDIFKQLPHDIMHVFLEGICRRHLWFVLYDLIDTKRSTLVEINSRIKYFNFGPFYIQNKPKAIREGDIVGVKKTIIMKASEMYWIFLLFPFIFYDICDFESDIYRHLNILRKILLFAFSKKIPVNDIKYFKKMISAYIDAWKANETLGLPPKLHYLVHLPNQIIE